MHAFDAWRHTIVVERWLLPVIVVGFDQEPEIVLAQWFDIIGAGSRTRDDRAL